MVFGRSIGPEGNGDWRSRATQDLFRNVLCVLLVRFSSIGDILLTTPLVRALARRHPEAKLVYVTKRAMAPLVADNPHLAEVVTLEPGEPIRLLARGLRALAPTHGLDLHGSVRSASLRLLVRCRWSGSRKRKLARTLLIATKLAAYRRRAPSPVAERYFEAARRLDIRPDGGPPEFCLGPGATDRAAQWLAERGLAEARLPGPPPGAPPPPQTRPRPPRGAPPRPPGGRRIPAGRRRGAGRPRAGAAARGRRGTRRREHRRRVFAPGNRRAARAGAGRGVRRYGCHAHGHRRRHASRRAVRTHRRAVRLLALSRACRRTGARARLPPLLRDGHRGLPARPPSLPRRYHPRGSCRRGGAPRRVNRATTAAEERLIGLVADAVRGPKREGLFALWLVVRSAEALLPPRPLSGNNQHRRLPALDAR